VTYLISRQNANDLRVNVDREIEIIRKLQSSTAEASKLEAHVSASVDKLIYRDERRERLFDVISRFAPLILVSSAALGLQVWRRYGAPEVLGLPVAIVYYALYAIGGWLLGRYVWGLLRLAYTYTRLGVRWTQIGALQVKYWWRKRKHAQDKEQLKAVIAIMEHLADAADIATAEQASGDDEQAQTTMQKATDEMLQRLAEIGVTLKSHPTPHY
jgi:hypothetical protein